MIHSLLRQQTGILISASIYRRHSKSLHNKVEQRRTDDPVGPSDISSVPLHRTGWYHTQTTAPLQYILIFMSGVMDFTPTVFLLHDRWTANLWIPVYGLPSSYSLHIIGGKEAKGNHVRWNQIPFLGVCISTVIKIARDQGTLMINECELRACPAPQALLRDTHEEQNCLVQLYLPSLCASALSCGLNYSALLLKPVLCVSSSSPTWSRGTSLHPLPLGPAAERHFLSSAWHAELVLGLEQDQPNDYFKAINFFWLCSYSHFVTLLLPKPCMSLWPVAAKALSSDFPSRYRQLQDGQTCETHEGELGGSQCTLSLLHHTSGYLRRAQLRSARLPGQSQWDMAAGLALSSSLIVWCQSRSSPRPSEQLPVCLGVLGRAETHTGGELHPRCLCGKKHRLNLCVPPTPAEPEIGNSPVSVGFCST